MGLILDNSRVVKQAAKMANQADQDGSWGYNNTIARDKIKLCPTFFAFSIIFIKFLNFSI